jgi:hypothetical protein
VRLLAKSGGQQRIQSYANARSIDVDAYQLHQHKTKIFDTLMASEHLPLRPSVSGIID